MRFKFAVAAIALSVSATGVASTTSNNGILSAAEVTAKFKSLSGNTAKISAVERAPIPGFYQIMADGRLFYVQEQGDFMFAGAQLFDFNQQFYNHTDARQKQGRAATLNAGTDGYIEYKADDEKHVAYVFTDPSCSYCQKLHHKIPEYNNLGITIRYLSYPRGGSRSPAYSVSKSIWCADDQQEAYHQGMKYRSATNTSCNDPVDRHYALGEKLGVRGTPAIFLEDGTMLAGYRPPEKLLSEIQQRQ